MSDMEKDFTEQELEQEAMAAASSDSAAEKAPKAKADKGEKKDNNKPAKKKQNRVARWFKELRAELKKVTWPTFKQTRNNTAVVIACCAIVGVFVWLFDWGSNALIGALLSVFTKS